MMRATAMLLLAVSVTPAAALWPSQVSQGRLAHHSDPQTLYVRPGNFGELLFGGSDAGDPANLLSSQDEYSNGIAVWLADGGYDVTVADDDSTSRPYWMRMNGWMESLLWTGQAAIWVVDDDFISLVGDEPAIADAVTSNIELLRTRRVAAPSILFDVSRWDEASEDLLTRWRKTAPYLSLGYRLQDDGAALPCHGSFEFVVCDEELIPEHYRGQAAAAWVRGRVGQVPVVLSPREPDFFRDVVWISCGVAGIWYRPLPSAEKEQRSAAVQLRAATTFLNRFPGTSLPLKVRPDHAGFYFCLEEPQVAWAGVLKAGAERFDIPAPAGLGGKVVNESWFNPATDQTIIQPLTELPGRLSVQAPDDNLWIYSISASNAASVDHTTITEIQEWSSWP